MSIKKIVYGHARRFFGQLSESIVSNIGTITILCIFAWCCTMWIGFSCR